LLDFFRSLKKGRPFSPSLPIKRPKATIIPVSFLVLLPGRSVHLADGIDLGGVFLDAAVADHEA
jgi:hypothetical protein